MEIERQKQDCPFLKEEKVIFCKAFPLKKILPLSRIFDKENICLSKEHVACPIYLEKVKESLSQSKICHFLGTENIIYCELSPIKKMIPIYSLKFEGPCSNKTYPNCTFYQKMLHGDQQTTAVQGFLLEDTLYYHTNHIWLKKLRDNVRLGLDDFGQFILGNIREAFLPDPGRRIRVDEPFMSLNCDDGTVELLSPLNGCIVNANHGIYRDSTLINIDPYGEGWLVEVQAPEKSSPFEERAAQLFHGDTARPWLEGEIFKLLHFVESEVGITAADGGEIWRGLRDAIGAKGSILVNSFFGKQGR